MPDTSEAWAIDQLVHTTETAVKILQTRIKIAVPFLLPVGLDIFAQLGCSELFLRPCSEERDVGDPGREPRRGGGGWKQIFVSNPGI